jgi:two-component system, NtrC family, response regulator
LEQVEKQMIEHVFTQHQGNISRIAKALGLSRTTLYRRLERHGLSKAEDVVTAQDAATASAIDPP